MRKFGLFFVALAVVLVALPAATQEDDGNIVEVWFVKPKPGMEKQFEEAGKKHMAWHRQQKDPWTWIVWETISGPNTGMYGAGTFGHQWSDFDNPPVSRQADVADYQATIGPYVASAMVQYYTYLSKLSHPAEGDSAMSEVLVFQVRFGKGEDFMYCLGKFHEAIKKTNWPVHYEWYSLRNGGEVGTYVLLLPRSSWAAFKPLEKPFPAMLEEAYGRQEAEDLLHKFSHAVKSESTEIVRSRPDLSYIPSPAK